ncbi:MAG: B12-binding domain-containing radical SAM protein [bacterium]
MSLLLCSVFRPFGVDDEYGRKENKLELFHNQVTREQGIFSIRYNHRSFGLYFIAENIKMPTVILDFPTLKQFRKELKKGYDYVGIAFIASNFAKAKKMCELVREVSPTTKIILGGHGTRIPEIEKLIDCDYAFPGEGIHQLRKLFREDVDAPIKHPAMPAADHKRILGLPFTQSAAVLVPGVGCPNACRFCATSHFYDKTYYPFLKTGQELYDTILDLAAKMKTNDFFVMDENFLKQKDRAMELLSLMERDNRTFNFSIFSSAETVKEFGIANMVKLGISYIWLGVESKKNIFEKTQGIDVKEMISELRANGIFVLASSILFLEHHTKETIWEDIDFSIGLNPDFSQFMQLGPMPQTQLYLDYKAEGKLREDIPYQEWHGQHRIWFDHPHFTGEETETYLRDAFRKEFETLGPSILRTGETMIRGLDAPVFKTDNPMLLRRKEVLYRRCKAYYYALTALKWEMPTQRMKEQASRILALYKERLGARTPLHLAASGMVFALTEAAKTRMNRAGYAHNPTVMKTMFRISPATYKEMKGRIQAIFRNRRTWAIIENNGDAGVALSLHFSGRIKRKTVAKLNNRINSLPRISLKSVRINVTPLADFNEETFEKFIVKLSRKCEDVRIYCSETHKKQITFFNKLMSKNVCSVTTF